MTILNAAVKINLFLYVVDRYENGYHALNSLVAFCDIYDYFEVTRSNKFSVDITGEFGKQLEDNIQKYNDDILYKTKKIFEEYTGYQINYNVKLTKNLPISAGLGGGSADSGTFLKFLAKEFSVNYEDLLEIAVKIGADVPMCINSQSCFVENIGEKITPLVIPEFYILLVNPRIIVSTPEIFKKFKEDRVVFSPKMDISIFTNINNYLDLIKFLHTKHNDLLMPSTSLNFEINQVLEAIYKTNQQLALSEDITYISMAGSGPTCFSLYQTLEQAKNAYEILSKKYPNWWIQSGKKI